MACNQSCIMWQPKCKGIICGEHHRGLEETEIPFDTWATLYIVSMNMLTIIDSQSFLTSTIRGLNENA